MTRAVLRSAPPASQNWSRGSTLAGPARAAGSASKRWRRRRRDRPGGNPPDADGTDLRPHGLMVLYSCNDRVLRLDYRWHDFENRGVVRSSHRVQRTGARRGAGSHDAWRLADGLVGAIRVCWKRRGERVRSVFGTSAHRWSAGACAGRRQAAACGVCFGCRSGGPSWGRMHDRQNTA
jgi:hypothetical protein